MKPILITFLFILSSSLFAQKNCEYSENISDSLGTYKSTKDYMMYEKVFAGTSNYIFFSLALANGTPFLNINFIEKSKGFIKAKCFDKDSKLYLQLNNGKIITLLHVQNESCGSLIRDEKGFDNRVLTAKFLFIKGSIEDLKSSPINLIRIKYLTDVEDYVIKKEFQSELDTIKYKPETYFVTNLHCIEN